MARIKSTFWQRYRYHLSAFVLALCPWYYYQSLHPVFPAALPALQVADYQISAMPYDENPPYQHDGQYIKDFLLIFSEGDVRSIRQAYLNIGKQALPIEQLQQGELGILHGSRYGQHVHALTSKDIEAGHKIWLTLERWDGQLFSLDWPLPAHMLTR